MNNTVIIIIAILVCVMIYNTYNEKPNNPEPMGALTQLYAKGPQDTYLTSDIEHYIPAYGYGYGVYPRYIWGNGIYPSIWNNPTRYNNGYPYYGIYGTYWHNPYIRYY